MKVEQTDLAVREALYNLDQKGERLTEYVFLLGEDSDLMNRYSKYSRGALYGVPIVKVEGSDLELIKRQ